MKIGIDARPVINEQTGLGRYIYNLVNSLTAIDQTNEYIIFVNTRLSRAHALYALTRQNLRLIPMNVAGVTVRQQLVVPLQLRGMGLDVYHYPHFDLPIGQTFRSILTIHDLTYVLHRSVFYGAETMKRIYTKYILALAIKRAHRIITISESTKQDLVRMYRVPATKIEVIYEATEPRFQKIDNDCYITSIRKRYNLPENFFLFVGERRPHKNLVRLIEAFYLFRKNSRVQKHQLILVGKSYGGYDDPQRKVRELGLERYVRFLGYIPEEDLPAFYNIATAFLFPSIYEGFGIPLLEAMSCGTPVITSRLSSMPEVTGEAALTVNPYDVQALANAMISVTEDATLREMLIQRGFQRSRQFSWENAARATLAVYEKVAKSNKRQE